MDHLDLQKMKFIEAVQKFEETGLDEDYEKCLYAKRQMCKCEQMIKNLKNKRIEELKKELDTEIISQIFIKEVVPEPAPAEAPKDEPIEIIETPVDPSVDIPEEIIV